MSIFQCHKCNKKLNPHLGKNCVSCNNIVCTDCGYTLMDRTAGPRFGRFTTKTVGRLCKNHLEKLNDS